VAIPRQPILVVCGSASCDGWGKDPFGPLGRSTVPAARGDGCGLSTCNHSLLAVRACGIPTLGNNGKIYRSLRWQQELPQQKLMRVRFERFGLSVLLETNSSFLSPDANESAPDSVESRDAPSFDQPSPESCSQPPYVVLSMAAIARRNAICVT
jgi:hypothetical protein